MKITVLFTITITLLACKGAKEAQSTTPSAPPIEDSVDFTNDDENTTNLQTNGDQIISLRGEFGALNSRSDAFTIQSASIDGSMLYVTISYSGGCEEHLFKCIGSRAISKSLPPQRSIQLIHTANNDMCEALIFKNLKIDILPFVEDPKSPIILHLDGYNTPLKFEQI